MQNKKPSQAERIAHFTARLDFETDPSDVHSDIEAGVAFTFIDVRSDSAWNQGHAVAALHMHHSEIDSRAAREVPQSLPVVVYCWGPGCNGAHRAALKFAVLGYEVKEMIGGFEYWAREGYPVEDLQGPVKRPKDPLTVPLDSITCDC